nr:lipase 3-like [Plodia interpunctella]
MRGNRYSRRHITLNADIDRNYWNFTYHENGYYDYPAIIDKVLSRTDKKQLIVIGHSQGTLNYFVMGSTRPDYNDKVKLFIALAPIFYSRNNRGVAALAPLVLPLAYKVLKALDQVELLGQNSLLVKALQEMCTKFKQSYKVCIHGLLFSVFGVDEDQIELEFVPIIMKQYFAGGASVKTIAHANQFTHGHYGQLDYGVRNMEMYGSLTAPLYNLTNISTKVVLMVGRNDFVATVSDTMKLLDALPNATYFEMPRNLFSHMDFVWSNQMPKYLFPYLHKFLDEYQ